MIYSFSLKKTFYFEMTLDLHVAVRNHTRSRVLLNRISPMIMSNKTIVQYNNQNIDTVLVKIDTFPLTQGSLRLPFFSHPPIIFHPYPSSPPSPWKSLIFLHFSMIFKNVIFIESLGCVSSFRIILQRPIQVCINSLFFTIAE